jgi:hypothetical protein
VRRGIAVAGQSLGGRHENSDHNFVSTRGRDCVRALGTPKRKRARAKNDRRAENEIDGCLDANSRSKVDKRGDEARQANQDDYEPASEDIISHNLFDISVGSPDDRAERFDIRHGRRAERHLGAR